MGTQHSTFNAQHSDVTAVILAAGAGTRLGALARRYSKATLPIAGRPLIAWVIASLRAAGVGRLIVVGHPSDSRLATFLRTDHPEIALVAQPQRRGIADALWHALPLLADQPGYLACACDSLFATGDIAGLIARGRAQADAACVGVLTMGVEATRSRSAVRIDGDRIVEIVEKPAAGRAPSGLVAMPLYWLPHLFAVHLETVPPLGSERYIASALNAFICRGGTVFAVTVGHRIEVTTAQDVAAADAWIRAHGDALGLAPLAPSPFEPDHP